MRYSIFVLFVLMSPSDDLGPVLIAGGVLILGGAYFVGLLMFNREVLETEPGDVSVFKR